MGLLKFIWEGRYSREIEGAQTVLWRRLKTNGEDHRADFAVSSESAEPYYRMACRAIPRDQKEWRNPHAFPRMIHGIVEMALRHWLSHKVEKGCECSAVNVWS